MYFKKYLAHNGYLVNDFLNKYKIYDNRDIAA